MIHNTSDTTPKFSSTYFVAVVKMPEAKKKERKFSKGI